MIFAENKFIIFSHHLYSWKPRDSMSKALVNKATVLPKHININ